MVARHWTSWLPCQYMLNISPELRNLWGWTLVYSIGDSKSTKFVQMMILGWPLTFLQYGQICILVAVAILEEVAWYLQICNGCFYQVAHGLLFIKRQWHWPGVNVPHLALCQISQRFLECRLLFWMVDLRNLLATAGCFTALSCGNKCPVTVEPWWHEHGWFVYPWMIRTRFWVTRKFFR